MSTVPSSTAPEPTPATLKAEGPEGIGGWMILPIIGFFGVVVLTAFNLFQPEALEGFRAIFGGGSEELSSLQLPVGLSMLFGLAVIVSATTCLVLLFQKKRLVVQAATIHYVVLAIAGLVDLWGETRMQAIGLETAIDPSTIKEAIRCLVIAAIWIPYFRMSRRVANTCVR